jgi:catechol 2,3-dioxygenase-like lactoylglutathione lyase family enzyme
MAVAAAVARTGKGQPKTMDLGNFSVSLTVKNLQTSKRFYETLGFKQFVAISPKIAIMRNGDATIGLFEGLERNVLTFNPGWDRNAQKKTAFTDVREIQRELKSQGVQLAVEADETTKGPASFVVFDPDGNQIVLDQHV